LRTCNAITIHNNIDIQNITRKLKHPNQLYPKSLHIMFEIKEQKMENL